ncbi:NCS2 family permease [Gloeothece verrucosa]|uniref:Xanthine/uracil/vitamin C permease n=1 Tax=Gloeothece verrucosa (strain PCC 7822) TaxID=497965 RepID=E0UED7_GLOV7|nr:NCS2 family permease [Gloeothece verrucosa]ADN15383.1 Xanthine/uracil/vitamin C permease [Gloeothece verrucosa PCC 7822]
MKSLFTWIPQFFQFSENKTNFRTEILAGVTTFLTMAYILAVNPDILSNAIYLEQPKDLFGQLVIATAISSAIATLLMAFLANYPFALAPGMGLNAFFAFSVVIGLEISWKIALSAVFLEGIIFILLTFIDIRRQIVRAIPHCLKQAIATGIGLFIAYIALINGGIIVKSEVTITTLANFNQPTTLMAIAGIVISCAFVARRVTGALLWGILATAALGWILQISPFPASIMEIPPFPKDLFGQALIGFYDLNWQGLGDFLAVVFVFLFVDLFDTIGTLTGVGTQAGYIDDSGELPKTNPALMADAIGTTIGGLLGTSTIVAYIESASGISEGGRTGFTGVVVAILFLLSIFFIPLISAIPSYATVPALLIVGVLMAGNVRSIRWDDPGESIPSFLTILIMPLSYSIAEGLAVGFISYPLIKAFQGKMQEITLTMWILAAVFVLRFVLRALNLTS